MTVVRVVTLTGDVDREATIAAQLATDAEVDLVLRCVDRVEALACIRGGGLDLAVAVGPVPWFDYQCVEEARRSGIKLMADAADPIEAEMLEVAGFEVLAPDVSFADLARSRDREETPALDYEAHPTAKLIAVWGPKGAPGRTTIAIELAASLAMSEPLTLLADVDLYGGDIAQMLGVVEELPTIVPLSRRAARGEMRDVSSFASLRRAGTSGPILLPGLLRAELWTEVSPFGWQELIRGIRSAFRYAVFDVGFSVEPCTDGGLTGGRNELSRTTVTEADVVIAVVRADPVGIRSFLWAADAADDLLTEDRLLVVANRVRPGEEREVGTLIRRHLGRYPVAFVPDRPDHVSRALWRGEPVSTCEPASPVAEQARRLCAVLGGRVRPRGFLSRVAGRRRA